jgi:translation initiation factor IF-2
MRQSGSDAADIIVLVIAADDGVSAQTIEILNMYKSIVKETGENGISLVIALNKIDKPGIDVEESMYRISAQLLEHGIVTEANQPDDPSALEGFDIYGPPVQVTPVSGLTGKGLDDLIEMLEVQSEVMDLRADAESSVEGVVLDAKIDKGLGVVVDTIIRWGTVKKGDILVSGSSFGKVRILQDASGKQVKEGLPSQPIRIIGFDSIPKAGDPIVCVDSEETAHEMVERRKALAAGTGDDAEPSELQLDQVELHSSGRDMMNYDWKTKLEVKYGMDDEEGGEKPPIRIPIIVKADADGTLAAVRDSLLELGQFSKYSFVIDPILAKIGPLLATEVEMARDAAAPIFCFNVAPDATIASLATESKVALYQSKIIYALLDEAKLEFAKRLPIEKVDIVHGRGIIKKVFAIGGKDEKVAGMMISSGEFLKAKQFRVKRNGALLVDRPLQASSMQIFKDDVEEVARGKECGMSFAAFNDFAEGDEVECYSVEERRPEL